MKFREINSEERSAVYRLVNKLGADGEKIFKNKKLVAMLDGRKEIFVTNLTVLCILNKLKKTPYSVGLFIGEIRRRSFILGIEGGSIISAHAKKKVSLDDKAEQLFLYGRDVFTESALGGSNSEGICLVANKNSEFLGIGMKRGNVIKNLNDKGWYLRRGG